MKALDTAALLPTLEPAPATNSAQVKREPPPTSAQEPGAAKRPSTSKPAEPTCQTAEAKTAPRRPFVVIVWIATLVVAGSLVTALVMRQNAAVKERQDAVAKEEAVWQRVVAARSSGKSSKAVEYLEAFPMGTHTREASEIVEDEARWNRALTSLEQDGSTALLKEYLIDPVDSRREAEALRLLEQERVWKRLRAKLDTSSLDDQVTEIDKYLKRFGDSHHAADAKAAKRGAQALLVDGGRLDRMLLRLAEGTSDERALADAAAKLEEWFADPDSYRRDTDKPPRHTFASVFNLKTKTSTVVLASVLLPSPALNTQSFFLEYGPPDLCGKRTVTVGGTLQGPNLRERKETYETLKYGWLELLVSKSGRIEGVAREADGSPH